MTTGIPATGSVVAPQAAPAFSSKMEQALAKAPAALSPEQAEIAELKAALAQATERNAALSAQPSAPEAPKFPKFIMPMSNCNICLPSGKRVHTSDGVIVADSYELREYLLAMVEVGNCYRFEEGDKVTALQTVPTK